MKIKTLISSCKKTLFSCLCLLEIAEVEAGEVLKIKESAMAKTCFQHKSNAEIGVFWQTLIILLLFVCGACSTAKKISKDFVKSSAENNYFRGLVVYDPLADKELINENGSKYFTPASNTKLFTFYTAYKTFKDSVTALKYKSTKDSLILVGTADPSLEYIFEENKTIEFLINSKQEVFLVDASISDEKYGPGWSWEDYPYYYMPERSLFPIYGNVVSVSKNGNDMMITPKFFEKNFSTADTIMKRRDISANNFHIGVNEELKERKIPFRTSNQMVADLLSKEIGKKVVLIKYKDTRGFQELKSVRYDSLYKEMLVESDNFIAEQLLLQVGNAVDSIYNVKKAIEFALENYLFDIPQKPRWVDGSGLSRYNLFTPESIVFLLNKMYTEIPKEKLLAYFPVGGESGTLENYYKNEKPYIFAKSGTLSNNYNLSGYLITKKGKMLIFSYMNNHYQGSSLQRKKEMNAIFKELYETY